MLMNKRTMSGWDTSCAKSICTVLKRSTIRPPLNACSWFYSDISAKRLMLLDICNLDMTLHKKEDWLCNESLTYKGTTWKITARKKMFSFMVSQVIILSMNWLFILLIKYLKNARHSFLFGFVSAVIQNYLMIHWEKRQIRTCLAFVPEKWLTLKTVDLL